jgi:hypothetical protein
MNYSLISKLSGIFLLFFMISCGGGSDPVGGNPGYSPDMSGKWSEFKEFTAGTESDRNEVDDGVTEYVNLVYEGVSKADVLEYTDSLLADGFMKIFDDSNDDSDINNGGFYLKMVDGVRHLVRFSYTTYSQRYDLSVSIIRTVEVSDKWDGIFPEFTAGVVLSSEERIDGNGYEYLQQDYVLITAAEIDAYINSLLADGFIRMPKNSYEKVADGKRYRFSALREEDGTRPVNFVFYNDITNNTVKPTSIVLSPIVELGVEKTYSLHYTPTGSNATCTGIKKVNLNASVELIAGATLWETKISSFAIVDNNGTLTYDEIIPPVYMICDGEEIPVIFFKEGQNYY